MLANVLIVLVVLLLFLIAFILVRTILFGQAFEPAEPAELPEVNADVVAEHLAAAIRYETVSHDDRAQIDYAPFTALRRELEQLYPRAHTALKVETVNRHSLLYTWTGKDASLPPVLLAAHLDVVPVDPVSRDAWKHPPFAGHISDGRVWGRGACDNKHSAVAVLEAVEMLLISGYQPQRTVLMAFGHDEEIGGQQGAAQIAGRLLASGLRLEAVLDEGGVILKEGVPGVRMPVALVGVTEKGYLTLEISTETRGGHSSMPPAHTSIGVLARAIARLESNPLPARLELVSEMFRRLGAFIPFATRMAFANQWLFKGLLVNRLSSEPRTDAMIRSTTAVTMIDGGVKDNLLPVKARAVLNFRIMPGERVAEVEKHVREVIADEAVQIHILHGAAWEPSPLSSLDSPAAKGLLRTLGMVYPETAVAPYLVSGATDARYYTQVCENVFRLSPCLIGADEIQAIHSTNEHIPVDTLGRMVQFYIQLVKNWTMT